MLALINDTGILVVVMAVLLLFGASRLPHLARSLGEAGREFRKAHDEASADKAAGPTPSLARPQPGEAPAGNGSDSLITLSRGQLDMLLSAKAGPESAAADEGTPSHVEGSR